MTVNVIAQARMGSTRLPGKVMMEVANKPLVGYLIDNLFDCDSIDKIIFTIPRTNADSKLADYLSFRGMRVCFGPEEDLATRFLIAVDKYPCDVFVRVCADSPMLSSYTVDMAASMLDQPYFHFGSIPGDQAEGFVTEDFINSEPYMEGDEREHLGLFFKNTFSCVVDTLEDFQSVKCQILQQQL
jgi:spore coat polysaccharide biosynthesis protein SpsF (cytidylyltransferase family)